MPRSRPTRAVAVSGAVLLCVACGEASPSLPAELPTDVPYAYHLQTVEGSDLAQLEGTLDLLDDCLVVMPEYEGVDEPVDPVVPILPIAVVEWDGTTLEVNGERAAVGDRISLGGGYAAQPPDGAFVPPSCPTGGDERYFTIGIL